MRTYYTLAISALLLAACKSESTGTNPVTASPKVEKVEKELIVDKIVDADTLQAAIEVSPPPPPRVLPPFEPIDPWSGSIIEPYYEPQPEPYFEEPLLSPQHKREPVEDEILDFPDVYATFPGGADAMSKFITDNIKYPAIDAESNVQGKVYVSFVVERDGALSTIKVMRGVSASMDREAKRVIRAMPNWMPATVKQMKVRSLMRLPIKFVLK
jgi:protein TonB